MACCLAVHLIRHEQTAANRARQYIGWTDEPIITQPKALSFLQPDIVYGSDLMRCRQTANGYFPNATFIENAALRELNFGDFELKTYEQLQHNSRYRAWIDDPLHVTPTNGERFTQFQARVAQAFEEVIQANSTYTFVVHGGVIRVLLALYGVKEQSFWQAQANHRTVYTLRWNSLADLKGGVRCTSSSEVLITENEPM